MRQQAGQHPQHEGNTQQSGKQEFLLGVSLLKEDQAAEVPEARNDARQRSDHAQLDQQGDKNKRQLVKGHRICEFAFQLDFRNKARSL